MIVDGDFPATVSLSPPVSTSGTEQLSGSHEDAIDTIASSAAGTVLFTRAFLWALPASEELDVVTMVSACGEAGYDRSGAHAALCAAKSAQAGFADILSKRLRPAGNPCHFAVPARFPQSGPVR